MILNLLELLMEMGVLKQCLRQEVAAAATSSVKDTDSPGDESDKSFKTMNAHRLIMTTIIRCDFVFLSNFFLPLDI